LRGMMLPVMMEAMERMLPQRTGVNRPDFR
jgi:hypothetical protein